MSIPNGNGNKIIPEGSTRGANKRDVNMLMLARDIQANGYGFVRSKATVDELQRLDSKIKYTFDKEAQMFDLYYQH